MNIIWKGKGFLMNDINRKPFIETLCSIRVQMSGRNTVRTAAIDSIRDKLKITSTIGHGSSPGRFNTSRLLDRVLVNSPSHFALLKDQGGSSSGGQLKFGVYFERFMSINGISDGPCVGLLSSPEYPIFLFTDMSH